MCLGYAGMDRRSFLQQSLAAAGTLALPSLSAEEQKLQPPKNTQWSERKRVFTASFGPEAKVQNFTSTALPLSDEEWRVWVSVSGDTPSTFNIGYAEGVPGGKMKPTWAELSSGEPVDAPLSLGNLPTAWKPKQSVYLRLKDGRHRLYFWAHSKEEKIVRYLAADSDDGRRYKIADPLKACVYHPADRAVSGEAAAKAGLSRQAKRVATPAPGESLADPTVIVNDATNVYQLRDGTFELYSAALVEVGKDDPRYMPHDNIPGRVRVIDRLVSEDGLHWEGRQRVIQADAQDHADLQQYFLSVTHTEKGRIGLLGHYRVKAQTMDLEWCSSQDGIHWDRPLRKPWLPRSEPGVLPDSYGVYAPHNLVQHAGKWHLFYTGTNDAHNHKDRHGEYERVVMHTTTDAIWG